MKHIHTFESFLNEAKSIDLKLSTNEYPSGTVARFRIESDSINLRKIINLSRDSWSKTARAFTDNEIGFESAGDRKAAMAAIQKSFDSGKNDVREFLMESLNGESIEVNENDQSTAKKLVAKLIKDNPKFKWLKTDLPKDYTLDDVEEILNKYGYGNEYEAAGKLLKITESTVNEAKLKDNSYQAVLFGKLKSGKWTIIKSTDPNTSLQTKEDLYPRGSNAKYTEYCIISGLGGNRGQSLQSDAEAHLAQLNSGTINHDTAREQFSKVEFI